MKILLIGGTGAMGSEMIKCFDYKKDFIYVTTRQLLTDKLNVKYLVGNALEDDTFITNILKTKYDVIIDFMNYNDINIFEKRVKSYLSNCQNYVFISSSRVYSDDKIITEKTKILSEKYNDNAFLNSHEYAMRKIEEETILKVAAANKNNYTIVRPYITFNDYRLQLGVMEKEEWLFRALNDRTVIISDDILKKKTTLSYGYDVANQIANLVKKIKPNGDTYQITTATSITWNDILKIYEKKFYEVTGKKMKIKINKNFYDLNIYKKPYYQFEYDRNYNRVFDSSKLYKVTGIGINEHTYKELEKCFERFLKSQKFKFINYKQEATFDRETHEKCKIKTISGFKNKIKYIIFRYFIKL